MFDADQGGVGLFELLSGQPQQRPPRLADLRSSRSTTITVDAGAAFDTQTIELTRAPCRFGGWRYYFVCPRLGHRCEILPLLDGEFTSREAHGVTYGSQSEGELDRATN